MTATRTDPALIWITDRIAVNLSNVTSVFCGKGGQFVIGLVGGESLQVLEETLTSAGRELLLSDRARMSQARQSATMDVTPPRQAAFKARI